MYNSMPRDLVEVSWWRRHIHYYPQGPFARVEKREDQLEVFLKYAGLFGVPEVLVLSHELCNKSVQEFLNKIISCFNLKSRSSCFILSEIFSSLGTFPGLRIYNLIISCQQWVVLGIYFLSSAVVVKTVSQPLWIILRSIINSKNTGLLAAWRKWLNWCVVGITLDLTLMDTYGLMDTYVKSSWHLETTQTIFDLANVCIMFICKANIEEFMGLEIKLPETPDEVKHLLCQKISDHLFLTKTTFSGSCSPRSA